MYSSQSIHIHTKLHKFWKINVQYYHINGKKINLEYIWNNLFEKWERAKKNIHFARRLWLSYSQYYHIDNILTVLVLYWMFFKFNLILTILFNIFFPRYFQTYFWNSNTLSISTTTTIRKKKLSLTINESHF